MIAEIKEELNKLEILLKKHDKYFDYSDDYSVVKRGQKEWDDIQTLSTNLKLAGYAEEVQEIFKKYYDGEYFYGCSKYQSQV